MSVPDYGRRKQKNNDMRPGFGAHIGYSKDKTMNYQSILERLEKQKGHIGVFVKNLATGEVFDYHAGEKFLAASVIKLPVFMCISKWAEEGKADFSEKIKVRNEDKLPVCGALTLFTDEPVVDVRTLCNLMISLSDNAATNILIKRFGMPAYIDEFSEIGLKNTELNRVLFDSEASEAGVENYIVPSEMAMLMEKLYNKQFVSETVSDKIIETLLLQQINHKIPGIIGDAVPIAHKTGEDDNLSNDVGIVYAKQPFIICMAGHDTCTGEWEELQRHLAYEVFEEYNR